MEAPNIQLYNLFRQDLHLSDVKSLELMNILDNEYKSGVKEDIAALSRQMNQGFQKIDARFAQIDARFTKIDARFSTQEERFAKIDARFDLQEERLRGEIKNAKNETNRYILSIFLAILLSFLALFLKK